MVKTLEFFRDISGDIRWRLIASNGRIVADSAESYKKMVGAKRGANSALLYKVRLDIKTVVNV